MFSKSTEYALRATIYIALKSSEEKKISIVSIAKGINAPQSFTAKILQNLTNKKNGFISSTPGPSGGFFIKKEARKLPIYRVVEAMGESDVIEDCILGFPTCSDETPCSMHKAYKPIKMDLLKILHDTTIDDLANAKDSLLRSGFVSFDF
ncbi:MAG: Rrf2 family transcriptional regulator [Crocinitomicaceae bacterium]|nr:Rrf2 family transcriptional regulator [Crocinitomicaceae bacterium]